MHGATVKQIKKSSCETPVEDAFSEKWNPMQDAYKDEKFNNYDCGPAAAIQKVRPYVVLKNPPKYLTKKGVQNLCSQYGRVSDVRYCPKTEYYFVDMATVSDMEAVFRALENNTYGLQIMIGKNKERRQEVPPPLKPIENQPAQISNNINHMADFGSSMFIPAHREFERPQIPDKGIVTASDYAKNPLLELNDPQHHFLIERDAHELERVGLMPPITGASANSMYMYRTGRAFIKIPDETKKFLTEKKKQSNGTYIADQRSHIHNVNKAIKNKGKCEECQRVTDVVCARCSTFFCGSECQERNWQKHRLICGQPKNLIVTNTPISNNIVENRGGKSTPPKRDAEITEIRNGCEKSAPPKVIAKITEIQIPPSGSEVCITSFSKSNVLFIRSTSNENNVSFFKMVSAVNAAAMANTLKPLKLPPRLGQIVVAKFEDQFNRAMILNVENMTQIKLVAIDYGNIDVKRLEDLFEPTDNLMNIPRMSIPVILKGVPDIVLTDDIRFLMNKFLDCIKLKVVYQKEEDFIKESGVYRVELFDDSIGKSLNKALATMSKPVEPVNQDIRHRDNLKRVALPTGKNIALVVMDNSLLSVGMISCAMKEHALVIQKLQEAVQLYGESLEPQQYTPLEEELCIAKYSGDKKWYRGLCMEVFGNGYPTIEFSDYGNFSHVPIADIRKYPKLFDYPFYTTTSEIKGLPKICNNEQVKMLEKLIPIGSIITCDLVEICEEEYIITLNTVIEQLKQLELL